MIATLEFNLDDKDEAMAHMRAVKALDMAIVLFEVNNIMNKLCDKQKKANRNYSEGVVDFCQALHDEMDERGINLDELIR